MHILTILDHPNPKSFSHAIAASFMKGAQSVGHTTELGDLHQERFNPIWTVADVDGAPQEDIEREHSRIARADAICLVFPLFWWGMPSMTKGWIDRVWSWGWAYDQLDDPEKSLQKTRSGLLLVPAGARSDEMERRGYTKAITTNWLEGTFGYFGFAPRRLELLCGSKGSPERRADLLKRSYEAGVTMPDPHSA